METEYYWFEQMKNALKEKMSEDSKILKDAYISLCMRSYAYENNTEKKKAYNSLRKKIAKKLRIEE